MEGAAKHCIVDSRPGKQNCRILFDADTLTPFVSITCSTTEVLLSHRMNADIDDLFWRKRIGLQRFHQGDSNRTGYQSSVGFIVRSSIDMVVNRHPDCLRHCASSI